MTSILFPEISTDTSHVRNFFRDTPSSLGSVLQTEFLAAANFGPEALETLGTYGIRQIFDDNLLSVEEYAESPYFREGLQIPESGIKESLAQNLAESYDRRFRRNLVLSRARSGFGVSALRFGAGIVGSVLDPINIGVGVFAPVAVGMNATARAATIKATSGIATRYGKTAGRFASGAGEAALGAAAVEPILFAGSQIQQDPAYGLYDSLINVTVGALLGGTVTGVGGKFADVLKRANPETIQQAYQAATSQLAEGIPVRVDAIFDADSAVSPYLRAEGVVKRSQREIDELSVVPDKRVLPPALQKHNAKVETLISFIKNQGKIDPDSIGVADLKRALDKGSFGVLKKGGIRFEEMVERAQAEGFFPNKIDAYDSDVDFDDFISALEENPTSFIDPAAQEKQAAAELYDRVKDLGIQPRGMTDEQLFEEIFRREDAMTEEEFRQLDGEPRSGITQEQLNTEIDAIEEMYERGTGVNYFDDYAAELEELSVSFKERVSTDDSSVKALEEDLDRLETQIIALRDNGVLDDNDLSILQEFDDYIQRIDEMGPAIQAGASCVIRTKPND